MRSRQRASEERRRATKKNDIILLHPAAAPQYHSFLSQHKKYKLQQNMERYKTGVTEGRGRKIVQMSARAMKEKAIGQEKK